MFYIYLQVHFSDRNSFIDWIIYKSVKLKSTMQLSQIDNSRQRLQFSWSSSCNDRRLSKYTSILDFSNKTLNHFN